MPDRHDIQSNYVLFAMEHIPQLLLSSRKSLIVRLDTSINSKEEVYDCGKQKCLKCWCLKEPYNMYSYNKKQALSSFSTPVSFVIGFNILLIGANGWGGLTLDPAHLLKHRS